jgi:hypothetical protein
MIEFNVTDIGYESQGTRTCMVLDGENDCASVIIENADELITPLDVLKFTIDYPLTHPAIFKVACAGGFTRKDFIKAVYYAYKTVYDEEGTEPEDSRSIPLNRARSYGKYGIWGHVLSDLWLEGAIIHKDGVVELSIGS